MRAFNSVTKHLHVSSFKMMHALLPSLFTASVFGKKYENDGKSQRSSSWKTLFFRQQATKSRRCVCAGVV